MNVQSIILLAFVIIVALHSAYRLYSRKKGKRGDCNDCDGNCGGGCCGC
ncbi:MAG: hypothetical protein J6Q75_03235 [Bacteroidaceae bacterium]|nr:hypothetical protein [Bacteroidaceae bacterium]